MGKPIALDHGVSQPSPELFGDAVERRPTTDKCPEFPPQPAMHAPENPPAMQETLAFSRLKAPAKLFHTAVVLHVTLDFFLQGLQHPRHRYQHRYSLAPNSVNDLGRLQRVLKNHRSAQQLRQENSQKLAEDVTQRQHVKKSNGMHQAFVLEVALNFTFQGRNVAENIAVGDHHAFGFGGGPGGKNNFERV